MKSTVARILFASLVILNHVNAQCAPATVDGVLSTLCTCSGKQACKDAVDSNALTCAADIPCIVNCIGEQACDAADIDGDGASSLTVTCDGKQACKAVDIDCQDGSTANTCQLICRLEQACEDVEFTDSSTFNCVELTSNAECPDGSTATTTSTTTTTTAIPTAATLSPSGSPTAEPTTATGNPSGSPTMEPTTAAPTAPTVATTTTTTAATTTTTTTTTAPAPEPDDDDDSDSDSSSSSSSDDGIIGAAAGLFEEDDSLLNDKSDNDGNDGGIHNMVISLSDTAIGNLWGMAILFIVVNAMLCYCYHRKQKKQRAEFKPDPLP